MWASEKVPFEPRIWEKKEFASLSKNLFAYEKMRNGTYELSYRWVKLDAKIKDMAHLLNTMKFVDEVITNHILRANWKFSSWKDTLMPSVWEVIKFETSNANIFDQIRSFVAWNWITSMSDLKTMTWTDIWIIKSDWNKVKNKDYAEIVEKFVKFFNEVQEKVKNSCL